MAAGYNDNLKLAQYYTQASHINTVLSIDWLPGYSYTLKTAVQVSFASQINETSHYALARKPRAHVTKGEMSGTGSIQWQMLEALEGIKSMIGAAVLAGTAELDIPTTFEDLSGLTITQTFLGDDPRNPVTAMIQFTGVSISGFSYDATAGSASTQATNSFSFDNYLLT